VCTLQLQHNNNNNNNNNNKEKGKLENQINRFNKKKGPKKLGELVTSVKIIIGVEIKGSI
jgi:hypothetical protein